MYVQGGWHAHSCLWYLGYRKVGEYEIIASLTNMRVLATRFV